MASNVAVETWGELIRPVKSSKTNRIDGIQALIMALGQLMLMDTNKESVYETRGLVYI